MVSCVSSDLIMYSDAELTSGNITIQVDSSSSTVSGIGFGYPMGYMTMYSTASETVKLGSIENNEVIKKAFKDKGYSIKTDIHDADYIVVIESYSDADASTVSIGFYEIASNQLLFVCKGTYGIGWGVQDDLNHALLKALEIIPPVN